MDASDLTLAKEASTPGESTLEKFLQSVEEKTADSVHLRLLKACRQPDQRAALEAELRAIISEIVNEA